MQIKDLKVEFRYLAGSIACMSVDSISGKPIHNDINNDDAIKLFNSLIGAKENSILEENKQFKEALMELDIKITSLIHRKMHEENFNIDDTDLDKLLQIFDRFRKNKREE